MKMYGSEIAYDQLLTIPFGAKPHIFMHTPAKQFVPEVQNLKGA
jgi:hypothetical protein